VADERTAERRQWSLLSSHGQVLLSVYKAPDMTVRSLARSLNFSERRIMGVLRELETAGMIRRQRVGRQNRYVVNTGAEVRVPGAQSTSTLTLLSALAVQPPRSAG